MTAFGCAGSRRLVSWPVFGHWTHSSHVHEARLLMWQHPRQARAALPAPPHMGSHQHWPSGLCSVHTAPCGPGTSQVTGRGERAGQAGPGRPAAPAPSSLPTTSGTWETPAHMHTRRVNSKHVHIRRVNSTHTCTHAELTAHTCTHTGLTAHTCTHAGLTAHTCTHTELAAHTCTHTECTHSYTHMELTAHTCVHMQS